MKKIIKDISSWNNNVLSKKLYQEDKERFLNVNLAKIKIKLLGILPKPKKYINNHSKENRQFLIGFNFFRELVIKNIERMD